MRIDIFEINLPMDTPNVEYKIVNSAFGPTDIELCYFKKALIGQTVYWSDKPLTKNKNKVIKLWPAITKIDLQRLQSLDPFRKVFLDFLSSTEKWYLHVEFDIDQYNVIKLFDDIEATKLLLDQVYNFFENKLPICPSFISKKGFQ